MKLCDNCGRRMPEPVPPNKFWGGVCPICLKERISDLERRRALPVGGQCTPGALVPINQPWLPNPFFGNGTFGGRMVKKRHRDLDDEMSQWQEQIYKFWEDIDA